MADLNDLLESYYDEIDPASRLRLLEEYLAAAGDSDPAGAYRKALYEYRCTDPANPERKVDKFMLAFLDYLYLFRSSKVFPSRHVKEVLKTLRGLELDEKVHTDPLFAEAFSLEIRNAVKRYFDTCKSDSYHRKFFGVTASNADEKENSAASTPSACPTASPSAWGSRRKWLSSAGLSATSTACPARTG